MEKYKFTVTAQESGLPLKRIVKKRFNFSSRFMTKIKYQDLLSLNGVITPGWVVPNEGDVVTVSLPRESSHFTPEDIPISILYEDEDLLFINKQSGLTVHPTKGHPDHTMANGIMKYILDKGEDYKIRFVNRLDMDTSGILLVAKNSHSQAELNKQMASGSTIKKYIGLVSGIVENDEFLIDLPIGLPSPEDKARQVIPVEMGGRECQTKVKVIKKFSSATILELTLLTGRTHQIRVHLSHIGFPLIGDPLYGGNTAIFNRQALHASHFSCLHPNKKEPISIDAPLPSDLLELIKNLE